MQAYAFRSLKTVDLEIRPIRHWTAPRVRAHVFLCMLAYHVEWHVRDALAPLLFHDTELAATRAERSSPIVSTEHPNSPRPRRRPSVQPTVSASWASPVSWRISARSPATPCACRYASHIGSRCMPSQPSSRRTPERLISKSAADSNEAARVYRTYSAHRSNLMAPREVSSRRPVPVMS